MSRKRDEEAELERERERELDRIAAKDADPPRGSAPNLRGRAEVRPPPRRVAKRVGVREALADLARIQSLPIYPTPFETLNKALGLGGLVCGYPHILAGGTGKGKTTFILDVATSHARDHGPALIVSLEMRAGHLVARSSSAAVGCSTNELLRGERALHPDEVPWPDRLEIVDALGPDPLVTLRNTIEDMTREHGRAPLVVIDYLQKLVEAVMRSMELGGERPDPRLATAAVSAELLSIARDLEVPMLIVSAVSRGAGARIRGSGDRAGKRTDPRSVPPDFFDDVARESGAIEYDAAALFVLHVSDELDVERCQVATITVAKARFGRTCHIAAAYNGAGGRWIDRGMVERERADKRGLDVVTAERAEELRKLGDAIAAAIAAGPKSRNALADELERRKSDIADAVHLMIKAGTARERGAGRMMRIELVATAEPALPGLEQSAAAE